MTAKQWREKNLNKLGNMRDYASIQQLLVLANLESYNALLIQQGKIQTERMKLLHELAVQQLKMLDKMGFDSSSILDLKTGDSKSKILT